jgi:hypothetical protein
MFEYLLKWHNDSSVASKCILIEDSRDSIVRSQEQRIPTLSNRFIDEE